MPIWSAAPHPPLIEQPWRFFATVLELHALGPCVDGDGLGWAMTLSSVAGTAALLCLLSVSRTGVCFASACRARDRARSCVRADRPRSTVDLTDLCLSFVCLSDFLAVCTTPPGSGDCSDNNHDWYNGHLLPPPFDLDYRHHHTTRQPPPGPQPPPPLPPPPCGSLHATSADATGAVLLKL